MLVITGTQRSGTSLIAKALIESGYDLGATWFDEEVQGGYENEIICAFYREYLGDPTFPFDDLGLSAPCGLSYVPDFVALNLQVAKFCYLLMNPAFVTIWHKFRPKSDTFLVMSRNAEDVVRSKARAWERFKHDSLLLQQTPDVLRFNFMRSLGFLLHLGYEVATLQFPQCVNDLEHINAALAALDPNVQIDLDVWKNVLDKSKIHYGGMK